MTTSAPTPHDAIIVGARCAGAATALLLARAGLRVLVVDRDRPGADTLSTHALMRGGVLLLQRWGLLDRVVAAGTPGVRRSVFVYGDEREVLDLKPVAGVSELYSPRRTVLDPLLVDAARAAGATVRYGVAVTDLLRDPTGRVVGVVGRQRDGRRFEAQAPLVVGADGLRSTVARRANARLEHQGTSSGSFVYGYFDGLATEGNEWFYRPGGGVGLIPTNGDQVCVWVGAPTATFMAARARGLDRWFDERVAAVARDLTARLRAARRAGPLRGFPGVPGFLRRAGGRGWALVGDAGSFKDPITAHGITDALRDAELLARAVVRVHRDGADEAEALAAYQATRDRLTVPLLAVSDAIAGYRWDLTELRALLIAMSGVMKDEVREILDLPSPTLVTV